jgi:hypothetical protein
MDALTASIQLERTTPMGNMKVLSVADIKSAVTLEEWQARTDLAACYRLMAVFGMTDLIYNHISARVPGEDGSYLVNPYGMLYEEITASNLVKIDVDGNTLLQPGHGYNVNVAGFYLHAPIHKARPDLHCIIHTHTRAGTAVSGLSEGLLPLSQTAMRFHGRVGYHEFEGRRSAARSAVASSAIWAGTTCSCCAITARLSAAARFRRPSTRSTGLRTLAGSGSISWAATGRSISRLRPRSRTR